MKGLLSSIYLPQILSISNILPSPNMSPVSPPTDLDYKYIFQFDDFLSTFIEQAFKDKEYSPLNVFSFTNFEQTFNSFNKFTPTFS